MKRIFLSCQQSIVDHPIPAYKFWEYYFVNALREINSEPVQVPNVDWAEGLTMQDEDDLRAWRHKVWQKTTEYIKKEHRKEPIDLFLGYLYPQQVETSAIRDIQSLGIPCVNFFCDNVREFRKVPEEFRVFDLNWVPEYEALNMYSKAGLSVIHAPMPCWVKPEYRQPSDRETEPVTFVGSRDLLRNHLLGKVISKGVEIKVRGGGWDNTMAGNPEKPAGKKSNFITNQFNDIRKHGPIVLINKLGNKLLPLPQYNIDHTHVFGSVSNQEFIRNTRESLVSIGINRVTSVGGSVHRPLKYSRLRDIEAPMLGACYLTEWTSGLEKLYEPGKEIETYHTADELSEKINELKNNRNKRIKLRFDGQKKALSEHTIINTLRRINRELTGSHL